MLQAQISGPLAKEIWSLRVLWRSFFFRSCRSVGTLYRVRTHPYLSLFSLFYILVKIGALISPYFRDRGDFGLICPYFLGCRIYSFWPIDLRFCMNIANRLIILGAWFGNNSLNSFWENIDLPKLLGKQKAEIWNNKVWYTHFAVNSTFWGQLLWNLVWVIPKVCR